MIDDWLAFVEPAPPGEDKVPSPDQKSFHTSTTSTTWGPNGGPPGRHRPARCRNSNLGFVEPTPPGKDKVPSPDHKSLHTSKNPTNRGQKRWCPGSIPPRTVWKPQPHCLIADWLGFVEPVPLGEDMPYSRIRNTSIRLQLQRPGDENGDSPGRCRPVRCGNPNPILTDS